MIGHNSKDLASIFGNLFYKKFIGGDTNENGGSISKRRNTKEKQKSEDFAHGPESSKEANYSRKRRKREL